MASTTNVKVAVLGAVAILLGIWLISGTLSTAIGKTDAVQTDKVNTAPTPNPDEYVGTETCAACHDEAFNSFSDTKHAKLAGVKDWKDKVQGCESCHGPGKAHSEDPTTTNIISFKNKNAKQISETCLTCHAGKEEHNNFRRGDHWRNNIGCTDCHTAHGTNHDSAKADSITLIGNVARQKPNIARNVMLKASEPQLCISLCS